ncbi:MAG TPA: LacI family DNA-binding transcriptional regulator [Bacteroidales bacterium]|nr:LacI family DNA-binding transcriptional regulator [Bacteroidales bacterium]
MKMTKNKEITIYDIAKQLNVSSATVSRALKNSSAINENTKKRVMDMARELGYQTNTFASSLRNNRTNTIGLIVPRLNSMFMSDVIAGIEKVVNEAGFNLIISQSLESLEKEKVNAQTMFNSRVDGLLVSLAYNTDTVEHFRPFIKKGIPLLFFDRVADLESCPTIVIDNFKAGYEITTHLIEQGCKNLVHVTGNLRRNVYNDRFNGFKQALNDHGLTFNSSNILLTDLSPDAGTRSAHELLKLEVRPDGVFVANDSCAASCIIELRKNDIKIPADMLFAGFNNDFISKVVEPNLTTIDYKGYEMGEITAQALINQLNNQLNFNLTHSIVIRHELIIRESSQNS